LEAVLDDYEGTILLVTHDRYLVDAIATQIWEIDTDESHLIIFKGIYSQLKEEREKDLARRAAQAEREEVEAKKKETPKAKSTTNTKEDKKKAAKKQELEKQIAKLEAQLSEISEKLAHPPKDMGAVVKLAQEYDQVQKEMDVKLSEWEELQSQKI
jgi:ATP-binding cassette, subfamily F, member 3